MKKLTPKQEAFVQEYLVDMSATQAAIRAGYSARTAHAIGSKLLDRTHIKAAIIAAKAARSERTQVDADWVLRRLADEADADLADLYDDQGNIRPMKDWPLIWRQGLVQGIETVQAKDGDGYVTVLKVKLSDRVKRIELIGRHIDVQAFKDKLDVSASDDLLVRLNNGRERVRASRNKKR